MHLQRKHAENIAIVSNDVTFTMDFAQLKGTVRLLQLVFYHLVCDHFTQYVVNKKLIEYEI